MPTTLSGADTSQTLSGMGSTTPTQATDPNTGVPTGAPMADTAGTAQQGANAVGAANQAAASMLQNQQASVGATPAQQSMSTALNAAQGPTPPTSQPDQTPVPIPASQQLGALSPMLAAILRGEQPTGGMDSRSLLTSLGIDPNRVLANPTQIGAGGVPSFSTAFAAFNPPSQAQPAPAPFTPGQPAPVLPGTNGGPAIQGPWDPNLVSISKNKETGPTAQIIKTKPAVTEDPAVSAAKGTKPEWGTTPAAPAAPVTQAAPPVQNAAPAATLPPGVPPGTQQTQTQWGPGYQWQDPTFGTVTYANGSYISSQYGLMTPELMNQIRGGTSTTSLPQDTGGGGFRRGGMTPPTDAQAAAAGPVHKNEFVVREPHAQRHAGLLQAMNSGADPKTLMGILRKTAATIPTPKAEAPPKPKTPRK